MCKGSYEQFGTFTNIHQMGGITLAVIDFQDDSRTLFMVPRGIGGVRGSEVDSTGVER
jgi:hypothetical protein